MHNGIHLPGVQPVMMTPLNDAQVVSLMAVHCPGESPQDKVEFALEIIKESMRQINSVEFVQDCAAINEEVKRQHREAQRKNEE